MYGKRQRTGALQDASRRIKPKEFPKVLECGSPLPLLCQVIHWRGGLVLVLLLLIVTMFSISNVK